MARYRSLKCRTFTGISETNYFLNNKIYPFIIAGFFSAKYNNFDFIFFKFRYYSAKNNTSTYESLSEISEFISLVVSHIAIYIRNYFVHINYPDKN